MKVLMLGWELPPHNSGGLGVACEQLCKALASQGADIAFILPYVHTEAPSFMEVIAAQPQDVATIIQSGTAYDSYKYVYQDGRIEWNDIFYQQQLYEHAIERVTFDQTFDVIHAHDWLTFRAALRVKQRTGRPLIVHVHSIERDRAGGTPGNPLVREIEEITFMLADRILAVSQLTKEAIITDYGVPSTKIEVIHNSIDQSALTPLDEDNAYHYLTVMRQQGYKVVTNVGRLTVQKGLPNFLRAAQLVVQKQPKTLFLIVGSGEQYHELMALAAELGIGANVLFTGFQRGKQWRDAFASSDLFVMPSVSEPFGLTPLEAAYYQVPSLVSRQSGVSEVLRNCLRVDFWDVTEMANQILAVLQYPELHSSLVQNLTQELETLSWDTPAQRIMDIYDEHLEGAAV